MDDTRVETAGGYGDPAVLAQTDPDRPHRPAEPTCTQGSLTSVRTEPAEAPGGADPLWARVEAAGRHHEHGAPGVAAQAGTDLPHASTHPTSARPDTRAEPREAAADTGATGPAQARVVSARRYGGPAVPAQAGVNRPHPSAEPTPAQPDLTDVRTEPGGAADEVGPVRVESSPVGPIVRPPDPSDLVILYLHGDRHLSGTPESALDLAEQLALRTGAVVVCPRYRSSFPGALDDVHAVYDSCRARGPVALAGERLGGGLVASLLVRLRDMGAAAPQCAVLGSALLDLTLDAPSLLFNAAAEPSFDLDELRLRATLYAAGTEPTNPLLSPLHANLHGLPPVQLLVAGTDPLLDDSLGFAARAARSGVTVDLRVREDAERLRPEAVAAMAGFIRAWTRSEGSSRPA